MVFNPANKYKKKIAQ